MTTFILLGLCTSGAWCLHKGLERIKERDRAELHALHLVEQPRHLRLIVSERPYDQARDAS